MIWRILSFCVVSFGLLGQPSLAQEADMAVGLSDAQLAELGEQWAAAINDSDPVALGALLDFQALGVRSSKTMSDVESERNDFVRGFAAGGTRLPAMWISQIESLEGRAIFLRVRTFDGMRGPLVRYDLGEGGHNYLLLIAESRPGGRPRVVDALVATNGQRLSDTFGAASQLIVAPSNSLLGRLFGLNAVDQNMVATFRKLGEYQLAGRTADAYAAVRELPDEIRDQRVLLNISVQLASVLDEDLYREELARLARNYRDDPTTAFLLIDYYFYKNDVASAMESVERMEAAFGADAALANLKATLAIQAGDLAAARRHAEQGVELEPENENSHWTRLTVLMTAGEYADGIDTIESLERDFGYAFDESSFVDNEVYAGFVRSPEYRAWLDAR
ncbi:MAG TPA: hypothetical protein VKA43_00835 [Gammaproteobacteria bacterium]|nr:hypothetical protein [Gammaproteobacteria bacterium]